MARAFFIPGVFLLFAALVLSFLASISLPFLPALDVARTHFGNGVTRGTADAITEIRFGVWAPCVYDINGDRACLQRGHGYSVELSDATLTKTAVIASSWTRGLAVQPVATAVTAVAFGLSFSSHLTITLLASLASFFAALLTLISFAIDIALFAWLRHQTNSLDIGAKTNTGAGFWLTFASLILLLLAGCTVCFGHRKQRNDKATTSYPMLSTKKTFWNRFRNN